jgi:hypothetical protein
MGRNRLPAISAIAAALGAPNWIEAAVSAPAAQSLDRTVLPIPLPEFTGTIGTSNANSVPAWPHLPSAPEGGKHPARAAEISASLRFCGAPSAPTSC